MQMGIEAAGTYLLSSSVPTLLEAMVQVIPNLIFPKHKK